MSELNIKKFSKFAERLAAGLAILLSQENAQFLYSEKNWEIMLKLLSNFVVLDRTMRIGFELFAGLLASIEKNPLSGVSFYEDLLGITDAYFKTENPDPVYIQKTTEFVTKLLKSVNKRFDDEVFAGFWKKIIGELGKLCQNSKNFVRMTAYSALQEAVLGFTRLKS